MLNDKEEKPDCNIINILFLQSVFKKYTHNLNYVADYNGPDHLHGEHGLISEYNFSNVNALKCDEHLILNVLL